MLGYSSLSIRNIRRTSQVVWVVKIQIFLYYSIIYEAIPCFHRLRCDGVSILHWWTWHISWLIELRWSWPAFGRFLVLADILPSKARVRLSCPFRAGIYAVLRRRTWRGQRPFNIPVSYLLHLGTLADVVYSSR